MFHLRHRCDAPPGFHVHHDRVCAAAAAAAGNATKIREEYGGWWQLNYAAFHCHAPACISGELWNADTGELICRNTGRCLPACLRVWLRACVAACLAGWLAGWLAAYLLCVV
jgi:hypothetical protein